MIKKINNILDIPIRMNLNFFMLLIIIVGIFTFPKIVGLGLIFFNNILID